MNITEQEKEIIRKIQEDLPLVPRPYKSISDDLRITEEDLLKKLNELTERKVLRRMGAVLRHQTVGFQANAMVVWCVPEDKINATVDHMVDIEQISHCYERETQKNWPYNLYTMIHAETTMECENIIKNIVQTNGIEKYEVLYSLRELKKSSMKYFME